MFMMIFSLSILFVLSSLMMFITNLFSKKTFLDREKLSPFECGFDPKDSPRLPFNPHFFLIAIIFLIFDVEITLLFPLILNFNTSILTNYLCTMIFFIIILILGIFHEWNQGALKWNF